MSQVIPKQHPAVVLRSHYTQLRALLAIAMIAVVGLTAAVVILATNEGDGTSASSAQPVSASGDAPALRSDGGPEESTRGPFTRSQGATGGAALRPDGGPEESTRLR